MSRTLVPVYIKPKLVLFMYHQFKSDTKACINGKRVKAVKITNKTHLGRSIKLLLKKSNSKPLKDITYSLFLSIEEQTRNNKYFGVAYKKVDGRYSYLEIPEEGVKYINDELEEAMHNSMFFFIDGFHNKEGRQGLEHGINIFCQRYNLFEFGYDVHSIRRRYYRWLKATETIVA